MNKLEISQYENKSVYFFYKLHPSEMPSRVGRGIVYLGQCYQVLSILKKSALIPKIVLQALPLESIAEMHSLQRRQKNAIEKALETAMFKGHISQIRIPLEIVVKAIPVEKESKETSRSKSEKQHYFTFIPEQILK